MLATSLQAQQVVALPKQTKELNETLQPVWAVGRAEGQSRELLSHVTSIAFDRQDNLYFLDNGNFRVPVFDRAGRFVRQIGKQGGGPGEFQAPTGIAILQNGDLIVSEVARGYSLFGANGTFKRLLPAGAHGQSMERGSMQTSPRGGIVVRTGGIMQMLQRGQTRRARPRNFIQYLPLTDAAQPTNLYEIVRLKPQVTRCWRRRRQCQ
jgi:hypothetical protein